MARRKRPTCGVLTGGLDGFIHACPLGWGGRTAACGKNAAGLRRTPVQPILDAPIRSRSADVTDALTSNGVIQILLGELRHRDQRSQSSQGGTMKTITSRRSLLTNSAATVAALGLGGKLVRAQEAPIRIRVIYDLLGA